MNDITFQALPIPTIDCHAHLNSHDGIEALLQVSRQAGIGRINIVCIPGSPERSLNATACALLAKARHPHTVSVFGGLLYNIDGPPAPGDLRRQAELLQAAGCDGVKMLEGKPSTRKRVPFRLDDPLYDDYYAFMASSGMPILAHVADPDAFWDPARVSPQARQQGWDYTDGTYPPRESLYAEVDRVLERFPGLRVILAHFYFVSADMARAERMLTRWPNVSFDITPGAEMYRNFSDDPEAWHGFFTRHQERIIFGTDNFMPREPWPAAGDGMVDKVRMIRQFLETTGRFEGFGTATRKHVMGIQLDRPALEKIYHRNFETFVGATPRPLNRDAALQHIDRVLAYARRTPGQEPLQQELVEIAACIQAS